MGRRRTAGDVPRLHAPLVQPPQLGPGAGHRGGVLTASTDWEVTGAVQRDAWAAHTFPPVERVAGGVWSVPVPIPDNPLRYVNCYVLETERGPVLVDPGWPAQASWAGLEAGLAELGVDTADVAGVLVTHAHSDHHGLAERVRRASGCWVGMHAADAEVLAGLRSGAEATVRNEEWPEVCGVPFEDRPELEFDPAFAQRVGALVPDLLVEPGRVGEVVGRVLLARHTPGHTPGHLCFLLPDEQLLLTGDAVLPRITSHIGTYRLDDSDPLSAHLAALDDLVGWAGGLDPEVLPGHEYRFRGLATRVAATRDHHAVRGAEVVAVVRELGSPTAWEVAERLTWSRSWAETRSNRRRLAVCEALAHLRRAELDGDLDRTDGTPARWRPTLRRQP